MSIDEYYSLSDLLATLFDPYIASATSTILCDVIFTTLALDVNYWQYQHKVFMMWLNRPFKMISLTHHMLKVSANSQINQLIIRTV